MDRASVGTTGWVGLHPKQYAQHFDTVEFNWTFHEREESVDQFQKSAQELAQLRIQAVLKVSGVATHEHRLKSPENWWPSLWAKYSQLHRAGVLGGLLWQLAPSYHCSRQALQDIDALAKVLPRDVLHIFEFRDSSWYNQRVVLETLRRHGFCLAWIHIVNEDGWCGDLPSGWASRDRTCPAVYLRLFGTKKKAVGRYSNEFLRRQILPHVEDPNGPEEIFIMFAQADVPDHAKADAMAVVELLGRVSPNPTRGTRWEREVLISTLGLAVGVRVEGTVQHITHRTIFIDIGRSCKARLCAHHARRVGLLEKLHVGTGLQGLVVEYIDFLGEWGIVGLTCHDAWIDVLGGDLSLADPNVIAVGTEKKSRWGKADIADNVTADTLAPPGVSDKLPNAGATKSTQGAIPAENEASKTRWSRKEFPPAARKREEEAIERAEIRKGQVHIYVRLPSVDPRKGRKLNQTAKSSDEFPSRSKRGRQLIGETPFGEVEDGPKALSADDFLLMQLERREGTELGFDQNNSQTFGADHDPRGWDAEDMFRANYSLMQSREPPRNHAAPLPPISAGSSASGGIPSDTDTLAKARTDCQVIVSCADHRQDRQETGKLFEQRRATQKQGRNKIHTSLKMQITQWSVPRSRVDSWADLVEKEEKENDLSQMNAKDGPEEGASDRCCGELKDLTNHELSRTPSECSEIDWPPIMAEHIPDQNYGFPSDDTEHNESNALETNQEDLVEKDASQGPNVENECLGKECVEDEAQDQCAIATPRQSDDFSEDEAEAGECGNGHEKDYCETDEEYCFAGQVLYDADQTDMVEPASSLMQVQHGIANCSQDHAVNVPAEGSKHSVPEPGCRVTARNSKRWTKHLHEGETHKSNDDLASGRDDITSECQALLDMDENDIIATDASIVDDQASEASKAEEEEGIDDACSEISEDDEHNGEDEEDNGDIFLAVCDRCGATHLMDVDIMSLGLEFTCDQLGFQCEGDGLDNGTASSSIDDASERQDGAVSVPVPPPRAAKLDALSPEEKKEIFAKHAMQLHRAKLKPKDIHKEVKQLFDESMPKERYRNSEIVTRKGERFIKINVSLDPGPGCEIGGILGWRTKMGRRGLGIKKMTKEEADRVCVSNKNRSHIKKDTGPAGSKQSYVFENRWSQHTPETTIGKAPKGLSA